MRMGRGLARRVSSSLSWRVAALRWCFMRLKTRSTMFRPLCASLSRFHGAARFPLGGAAGVRPNDSAGSRVEPPYARSMSGRVPMDRVALVARAQTDLDDRAPAVGCHVNFGIPPSPGDADGPGAPFFGAPAVCRWTFTPVGSMAGTCDNYHAKLKSLTMSGSPL